LGVGTTTDDNSGSSITQTLLPVPRGCTAANFSATATIQFQGAALALGFPMTFSLGATTDPTGASGVSGLLSCTAIINNPTAPISCQSNSTAVIPPNSYVTNQTQDGFGFALQGANIMISFTCQ
jgi:hypothetical protein